jgi:hypothetical protein
VTRKEKDALYKIETALGAVRGVSNPADIKGMALFHSDMQEVRGRVIRVLRTLRDPSYPEELDEETDGLAQLMRYLARKGDNLHNHNGWWNESAT